MKFFLNINGAIRFVDAPPQSGLLDVLRDDPDLTGVRYSCGHGACGACLVLVGGEALASCTLAADQLAGRKIVTIEGLAENGMLHPVQRAFIEEDATQCRHIRIRHMDVRLEVVPGEVRTGAFRSLAAVLIG